MQKAGSKPNPISSIDEKLARKESKTQLLKSLDSDVLQLKKDVQTERQRGEAIDNWINTTFKASTDKLRDGLSGDISQLSQRLDAERAFAREITTWIKNNLGVNLELVNAAIDTAVKNDAKRQEEVTKKREEGLWMIFGKKFDSLKSDFEEERKRLLDERKKSLKKKCGKHLAKN